MPSKLVINETLSIPADEIRYRFSRSSGPGGQHVNKVETRVEVIFNVRACSVLSEAQKLRLLKLAARRADQEDNILVASQQGRSRSANMNDALDILRELIVKSLKPPVKRVKTGLPAGAKATRVRAKKKRSQIKGGRGRLRLSNDDLDIE